MNLEPRNRKDKNHEQAANYLLGVMKASSSSSSIVPVITDDIAGIPGVKSESKKSPDVNLDKKAQNESRKLESLRV